MSDKSAIEWTDATWNPVLGCSYISQGCKNCYAVRSVNRVAGNNSVNKGGTLDDLVAKNSSGRLHWTGSVALLPDRLGQPLHWKQPKRIFVNSMSDLFHEDVPDEFIDQVFAVMASCPQHVFQILTKRIKRALKYFEDLNYRQEMIGIEAELISGLDRYQDDLTPTWTLPLPSVWLGVSVENQRCADERIPLLLQTPAAVRFLSCEPLLGPIRFRTPDFSDRGDGAGWLHAGNAKGGPSIDWVIAGGESGPKARPMHPDWVRSLRDQCQAAGVPFFFKQWGEWCPFEAIGAGSWSKVIRRASDRRKAIGIVSRDGAPLLGGRPITIRGVCPPLESVLKVGKKAAGAVLDGQEWREFPEVSSAI